METGHDKVKKICDVLRKETLEPAQIQADEIIKQAQLQAEKIVAQAQATAYQLQKETQKRIEKEEEVFKASTQIAFKQAIGELKNAIVEKLFHPALLEAVQKQWNASELIQESLKILTQGLAQLGLAADAHLILSRSMTKQQVAEMIAKVGLEAWSGKILPIGSFEGGLQLKISSQHLTIDLSDEACQQLLLEYASDNLKRMIFNR